MPTISKFAAVLIGAVVLQSTTAGVCAQEPIRTFDRDYWPDGTDINLPRLDWIEDRDGDGMGEFFLGDYSFGVFPIQGKVSVVSSDSGLELAAVIGADDDSGLGWDTAVLGDVNGDGISDFGATSIDIGSEIRAGGVWIWSGRDFSLLYRDTHYSSTIASVGDVNGDGLPDVAYVRGLVIRVIAGGSFEQLYEVGPDIFAHHFGFRIVNLGDVNGDRVPDFAASAPFNPLTGEGCFQAWIFTFSGLDGTQLYRIQGKPPCDYLGYGMVAPGDLTGDGIQDLAAVAGFRCVQFFDGRNGALLGEACDEHQLIFFGRGFEAVGDINANGYGDVLVRGTNKDELPPPFMRAGQGEAWLVDGGTREFLYRVTNPRSIATQRYGTYGLASTDCGDWNDDGQLDLAIGAPGDITGSDRLGLIDIVSGHPFGVRSVEDPCGRTEDGPRIGSSGIPVLGRKYPIHLCNVPPGTRAMLVVGSSALGSSRAGFAPTKLGLGECGLLVRPDQVTSVVTTQAGGKDSAATVHWKIPSNPAFAGLKIYAQWIVPQGRRSSVTTRALEITIQASLPLPYVP